MLDATEEPMAQLRFEEEQALGSVLEQHTQVERRRCHFVGTEVTLLPQYRDLACCRGTQQRHFAFEPSEIDHVNRDETFERVLADRNLALAFRC